MKRAVLVTAILLNIAAMSVKAQQIASISQDTLYTVNLDEVDVMSERIWANDTARYRYNQMRHYIKMILPYVNAATKLFNEANTRLNDPNITRSERKAYIKSRESDMRTQFEDKIEQLNTTQGRLLVLLISRQTGINIYKMLQEFKNPIVALKWQAWARLNGIDLNERYDPVINTDIEHIMISFNYPLPAFYNKVQ